MTRPEARAMAREHLARVWREGTVLRRASTFEIEAGMGKWRLRELMLKKDPRGSR